MKSYKESSAKYNATKTIKATRKRVAAYKALFKLFKSLNSAHKCGYETYIVSLEKYTWDHEERIEIAC